MEISGIESPDARKTRLIRTAVDLMKDRLGMDVDKGIREMIVLLQALDIPTHGSCEGRHPDHDEDFDGRFSAPYIDIGFEFSIKELKPETQKRLKRYLETARKNMKNLLTRFYRERDIISQYKLCIKSFKSPGCLCLSNTIRFEDGDGFDLGDQDIYGKCRKEIDDFTVFLRELFFSEDHGGKFNIDDIATEKLPKLLTELDAELAATDSLALKSAIDRIQGEIRTKLQISLA